MKKTEYPTYKCVSCDFYDQLESWATFSKKLSINYLTKEGIDKSSLIVIKDLVTINKEEFLITDTGEKIRLDLIQLIEPTPL